MNHKLKLIFPLMLILMVLTGCEYVEPTQASTPNEKIQMLDITEENAKLDYTHDVADDIKIATHYRMGEYDIDRWLITDSKTVELNLDVIDAPDGTEIFVEHVHVDVSVAATAEQINGLPQDSMDDSFHGNGTPQPGWAIGKDYGYTETFAIEGFSETLISGWGHYASGLGYNTVGSFRLTERNLITRGAYGSKMQVVYNLAVKYPGEDYYHGKTVVDQLFFLSTQKQEMDEEERQANELEYQAKLENEIVELIETAKKKESSWTPKKPEHIEFLENNTDRFLASGYNVEDGTIYFKK